MLYKMAVKKAFTYCTGVLWQLINVCKVRWSWKLLDTMLNINYHDYNIVLKLSQCSRCKLLSLSKQKKVLSTPLRLSPSLQPDTNTYAELHTCGTCSHAVVYCFGHTHCTSAHSTLGSFLTAVTRTACAYKPSGHRPSSVCCCKPPATSKEPKSSFKECPWLLSPTHGTAATHWQFWISSCRWGTSNFLEALSWQFKPSTNCFMSVSQLRLFP